MVGRKPFIPACRRPNWELLKEAGFGYPKFFPTTPEEVRRAEDVLAKDLEKLSLEEHERALFDLHGISQVIVEDEEEKAQDGGDEWNMDRTNESMKLSNPSPSTLSLTASISSTTTTTTKLTMVERRLLELEEALQSLQPTPVYYHRARAVNPSYVNDRAFRLMFLRCQQFDPIAAAELMEFHFQMKASLFVDDDGGGGTGGHNRGDDTILGRDVQLSDMTPEDWRALRGGCMQVLPERDACGRSILVFSFCARKHLQHLDHRHIARSTWYLMMNMLKDENTQKKGLVVVVYHMGQSGITDTIRVLGGNWLGDIRIVKRKGATMVLDDNETICQRHGARLFRRAIPTRISATHFCVSDPKLRILGSGMALFLPKYGRHRFRIHCGTVEQVHFNLQTYGIPTWNDSCPMKVNGEWSLDWHQEWLEMQILKEEVQLRRQVQEGKEESTSDSGTSSDESAATTTNPCASDIITIPHRFDVLFGKAKKEKESTGNMRALHLVTMNQDLYERTTKYKKTEIADTIVKAIQESGGRFLKRIHGGWIEVDDAAAREKISHFFRQIRVRENRKNTNRLNGGEEDENDDDINKNRRGKCTKRHLSEVR